MSYEKNIIPPLILPPCGNKLTRPAYRLLNWLYKRRLIIVVLYLLKSLIPTIFRTVLLRLAILAGALMLTGQIANAQFPVVAGTATSEMIIPTNSHVVFLPSNIQPGDLLLIFWADPNGSTNVIIPGGWTVLYNTLSGNYRRLCLYKVAVGTEGTFINVQTVDSERSAHNSYRISAGTYEGIPVAGTVVNSSSPTMYPTLPSLLPVLALSLHYGSLLHTLQVMTIHHHRKRLHLTALLLQAIRPFSSIWC